MLRYFLYEIGETPSRRPCRVPPRIFSEATQLKQVNVSLNSVDTVCTPSNIDDLDRMSRAMIDDIIAHICIALAMLGPLER